jgi:hypothetical protein
MPDRVRRLSHSGKDFDDRSGTGDRTDGGVVGNIGEEQLAGPTPLDRMNVADC